VMCMERSKAWCEAAIKSLKLKKEGRQR